MTKLFERDRQVAKQFERPDVSNERMAGADPGFFLGGGALVSCSILAPTNHIVFFW